MPKPYPPQFRRKALDLLASGRSVPDVAAVLQIAESCLYRWKQQDLVDRGLKPGVSATESKELAEARRRIRDLEEELKILRKAAAYFAQETIRSAASGSSPSTETSGASSGSVVSWESRDQGSTPGSPDRRRRGQ